MDEDPFRPPWEDDEPPASGLLVGSDGLLIPLARAQDAVARLEAAVAAAQSPNQSATVQVGPDDAALGRPDQFAGDCQ